MNNQKKRFVFTFEWHSLIRDLWRNSWLILLAGIIAFMCIYIGERSIYSPTYTSSATLVIRAKSSTSGDYSSLTVSSEMTQIFASVFKEPSMKDMAAKNLGLDEFDGTIKTGVSVGVNLMSIDVTSSDPERAYHLLSSMLEVYPNISEAVFSNTVIDILLSPQMPDTPNSSVISAYRMLIVAVTVLVMAALIVVLSLFKETVKHESAFSEAIDSQLLATVTHERPHVSLKERMSNKKRARLIDDAYASLKFAEDYQKIATKLEHLQKKNGSKTFAITSVAENEGKSTAAANIALALAGRGYNVLLLDLDVRKPSLHKIFGCRDAVSVEFSDVLAQKVPVREYKFLRYKKTNMFLALNKRYRADAAQWLGTEQVKECIATLSNKMDFVIIDTSPIAASADAASLVSICDETILIVRTDFVTIGEINDTVMTISNVGGKLAGCILNDVYKPFTLFGQMGTDENGMYAYEYGTYRRYRSNYGKRPLAESVPDGSRN